MVNDKISKNYSSNGLTAYIIDSELEKIIYNKISLMESKVIVIGSGITSSHLGDERNLREFLIANSVSNYLREKGRNTLFLLFDDSYDPLDFRQLRVAVNKDEKLINKFEKYCGMPIKLIPDPYDCHLNYSSHYQMEILRRFHSLDMYPTVVDSHSSYESGLYDFAKEIVFTQYVEISKFLKKEFSQYTMKNLFWSVCPKCSKMGEVNIKSIKKGRISIECLSCKTKAVESWKQIKGKFSWKLDAAIKWNTFKIDFEPFSKAYLDPDVGSYFIAKKLSEKFFGGQYPEIVHYGQVLMDKSLSYKILSALPKDIFWSIFLTNRKKDIILSDKKIIQFARDYKIDDKLSYHDYVVSKLPYELLESSYWSVENLKYKRFMEHGLAFARHFLKKNLYPQLPKKEFVKDIDRKTLLQIKILIEWIILYKTENEDSSLDTFSKKMDDFFVKRKIMKIKLFPIIRKILSQEQSLPMYKTLYYAPNTFFYGCLLIISGVLSGTNSKLRKKDIGSKSSQLLKQQMS